MKIAKLMEFLEPHSTQDLDVDVLIWDVDNQEEKMGGIGAIRFVFGADGKLIRIALEAQ